ncbi:hypothetical protein [Streptomyces sp. NPDC046859]|uniref:hypothetical protein n=1 Tax=Streptomyces sp. NPDC046859 TaxID=3155734 RepID=UPI00340F7725
MKSVNEALLPVVQQELEVALKGLGTVLTDKETEADLVSVLRSELMRRVLPQFTEAVRAGVLEGIRTRQMHLAQLAVLHRQGLEARTMQVVLTRLEHEAAKAGLQIVGDSGDRELFNVVEEQPGVMKRGSVAFELVVPAYVDKESGKLVERGWLRAVPKTQPSAAAADKTKPGQRRRATHTETSGKQQRDVKKSAGASQTKKKAHRGRGPGTPSAQERVETRRATGRSEVKSTRSFREPQQDKRPEERSTSAGSNPEGGQSARVGGRSGKAAPHSMKTNDRAQQESGFREALRAAASKQKGRRGTR